MRYILTVYGEPYATQSPATALCFAQALIRAGHTLPCVFFYDAAVQIASSLSTVPQDEVSLRDQWVSFAKTHATELVICSSAALRRGLLTKEEATRQQRSHWNIEPPFILGGLGILVDGMINADRTVVFGK